MFAEHQFSVTKVWPSPGKGVSCAFRQWRADSHCAQIHGYDLWFEVTFSCDAKHLTSEGWVVDFGRLKYVQNRIDEVFDHKTIVAEDDPYIEWFKQGERLGTMKLSILPKVGCEAFAMWLAVEAQEALFQMKRTGVYVYRARVWEHQSNNASYLPGY